MDRRYQATELRLQRAEGDAKAAVRVGGYAAVFNSNSVVLDDGAGPFVERIRPGAFAASLGADVRALFNHDPNLILGRSKAGTLRLQEDHHGLLFELDLPDTQLGRDLAVSIERGDIREMSFAFTVPKGGDEWAKDGTSWLRTIKNANIKDVSPVTYPAYQSTEVGLRSADISKESLEGLREARDVDQKRFAAEKEARERRLRLIGREFSETLSPLVRDAEFRRFKAERTEARDATMEDKLSAIWYALYALLGHSYMDNGPGWRIKATYTDHVIVETAPGMFFSYPTTFAANNAVTLGAPSAVEAQWVPLASGAA